MISRKLIIRLTFAALALPVVLVVIGATGMLLANMGDRAGSRVLGYVTLVLGIIWVTNLIFLILVQAISSIESDEPPESPLD